MRGVGHVILRDEIQAHGKTKSPHVELFERANLTERIGQGRQIQFGIGLQEIKQTPCDGLAAACPVAFDVDGDQRLVQG